MAVFVAASSREAGKEAAGIATSSVAKCLTTKSNMRLNGTDEDFVTYGIPGKWIGRAPENSGNAVEPMIDVSPCQTKTDRHGVAYSVHGTQDPIIGNNRAHALGRNNGAENALIKDMAVRRLTPTECERLQGFPDGYTQVPHRNKPAADGPRYKALGNSMAVPVMRWIGERIVLVNDL